MGNDTSRRGGGEKHEKNTPAPGMSAGWEKTRPTKKTQYCYETHQVLGGPTRLWGVRRPRAVGKSPERYKKTCGAIQKVSEFVTKGVPTVSSTRGLGPPAKRVDDR